MTQEEGPAGQGGADRVAGDKAHSSAKTKSNSAKRQSKGEAKRTSASSHNTATSKSAFAFAPLEPWPEHVDGAELLDSIVAKLNQHLVLPEGAAEAIALWVLFSSTFECWEAAPRLVFSSKLPECGKTTAITMVGHLVPKPLPTANMSSAVLFRLIEKWQPTILIDEADTFLDGDDGFRGILNSGHTRDHAYVLRCNLQTLDPERFSMWAPIGIAKIGGLNPTLASRSIVITMQRKRPTDSVVRFTRVAEPSLKELGRKAARWAADNSATLVNADPDMPSSIGNREADNWRPLVAIADRVGGRWPGIARDLALLFGGDAGNVSLGELVLADIRDVFLARDVDRLTSAELCRELAELECRPWSNYRDGVAIGPGSLAKLLANFDIGPRSIRTGDKTPKGYYLQQFADAFARYLQPLPP
jgi:putative DNA primase/helicase